MEISGLEICRVVYLHEQDIHGRQGRFQEKQFPSHLYEFDGVADLPPPPPKRVFVVWV